MIGSDQVATFDGTQIGKPGTHENAVAQLQAMRGRSVEFHSALCLFDSRTGDVQSADIVTRVRFRRYSRCRRSKPICAPKRRTTAPAARRRKASASRCSKRIESDDPTALIGLPLIALTGMLRERRLSASGGGMSGVLYLIPNTLGEGDADALAHVLPEPVRAQAAALAYYIGENAKTTRAFLKKVGTERPIQEIEVRELNVNTPAAEIDKLLAPILAGTDAGLVSEAGCPAVADPGALLVRRAHQRGVKVVPFVGPSSILLALMASGMNGQSFAFNGYLPVDASERAKRLRELEQLSRKANQTQIFIETPYRNRAMLDTLDRHLRAVDADLRRGRSDAAGRNHRHAHGGGLEEADRARPAQASGDLPAAGLVSSAQLWLAAERERAHGGIADGGAEAPHHALADALLLRVIDDIRLLDDLARHVARVAETVGKTEFDALLARSRTCRKRAPDRLSDACPRPSFTASMNCVWIWSSMSCACAFIAGVSGENGSNAPLFAPDVCMRRWMPSLSIRPVKPKPSISTPIEPTMLARST